MNLLGLQTAMRYCQDYDYEVEYLESHGTEYIDTGLIIGSSQMKVEGTILYHTESCKPPCGARGGAYDGKVFCVAFNESTFDKATEFAGQYYNMVNNISRWQKWIMPSQNQKFTFTHSSDGTFIDRGRGNELATDFTAPWEDFEPYPSYRKFLFFGRDDSSNNRAIMRGYALKIWDKEILLRDMIPVVKDGIGYMYDKVNRKIYKNAGSGNFTWKK